MPKGISKAFKPTKKMWHRVAAFTVDWIKKRTDRGIDRNWRKFPQYSDSYAEYKSGGMASRRTSPGKPSLKIKSLRGISTSRQVHPPNFRLRGWTMRDLSVRSSDNHGSTLGWRGEFAGIVHAHEEKKKYKVGGISNREFDRVIKLIDDEFVKQWNMKVKNTTIVVKVPTGN